MSSNDKVIKNFLWRFFERCGAQGVSFVIQIVLARILAPDVYGTIALITVFTTILQVFVDSGMGNALIQKKNADNLDFSSVFYFNIVVCIILYMCMFFAAPLIAVFYENNELVPVIRILSLTLVISGVKNVQQAYVSRTMQFKKFFFSTLAGTIGAAIIGIALAYNGFGVWALVAQQIFNATLDTIVLWITVKWRPEKKFSLKRLKGLFSYGWKLLASSLLNQIYSEITTLIIGKVYTTTDLAQYNRGNTFPMFIINNVNSSIDSVLLPTMSKEQDNVGIVKNMTRRAIKTSTYVIAPLMMGLAFVGEPLVSLILTDKWLPCVPFMRVFCITYMFYPIHTANLNAIKALGRSDLYLKLEIIKKIAGIVVIIITMKISVMAMAYGMVFSSIINQIINSWPNRKLLGYGYFEQIKDILPNIILAITMGCIVYPIKNLALPTILILIIQVCCGGVIYILFSYLFKLESFAYVLTIAKKFIQKRR